MALKKEDKEIMSVFDDETVRQLQDINSNPAFSAKEKKIAISKLKGHSVTEMIDFTEKHFRNFDDES